MRFVFALCFMLLFFWGLAAAQDYGDIVRYKYNPIHDWWKFRPNNTNLAYNPMNNEWVEAYPGEKLRFNAAEDTWEIESPHKKLGYDIFEDKWFLMIRQKDRPEAEATPMFEPKAKPEIELTPKVLRTSPLP